MFACSFGWVLTGRFLFMADSDFVFFLFCGFDWFSRGCMTRKVLDRANLIRSPGESWAGSPPTPLVRLRGKWGCHKWYQSHVAWSLRGVRLGQVVLWS